MLGVVRVATIDIGTNSVLLLVAEKRGDGSIVPVLERATITRLGQGVDQTGELAAEAVERTIACLREYAAEAKRAHAATIVAVGTSAMRDARGGPAFATSAADVLGVAPRIVSGRDEAALTFAGAVAGLSVRGMIAVFDVGGGSTEIVGGSWDGERAEIAKAASIDVGSVRLTERHVRSDPPTPRELEAVARDVDAALVRVPKLPSGAPLVGVAGTVTTIAAVARAVVPYDGARVHGIELGANEIASVRERLASLPVEARRRVAGIEPKRADVIVAGAIVVERVLAWAAASTLIVSDRGVRWGLALEALRGG